MTRSAPSTTNRVSASSIRWTPDSGCPGVLRLVQRELPRVGGEGEELAVTPPAHRDGELLARFLLGETATKQIEEEPLAQIPVIRRGEGLVNGAHERRVLTCTPGEDLLGLQNVCCHEHLAVIGDLEICVVYDGQPEQLGRVDQREKVVDLERQVVRERWEVLAPASRRQDLEQAGHPADSR